MLGLVIFISAIYYIGSRQALFGAKVRITAEFDNVAGLQPGNNIRFSGIKIGTVERIEIASDSLARVYMLIDKQAAKYIKKDAFATIDSQGLMGNKVLSISAGGVESLTIEEGDQLATREPLSMDDVISSVKSTSDNAKELAQNLIDITEDIKDSKGLLGKLVADKSLAQRVENTVASVERTGRNARQITQELEKATNQINQGGGLLTKLLYEDEWSKEIGVTLDSLRSVGARLSSSSREFEDFVQRLSDDEGAINTLVSDTTVAKDLEQLIRNMRRGTEDLDKAVDKVNQSWLLNLFSGKEEKEDQ